MRFLRNVSLLATMVVLASSAFGQVFDDTPDNDREQAPMPEGVEPVIPLNRNDQTYDLWKLVRDDLREGREPGPINVQRFWGGTGWQGIPTFFRLPVALVPEDLEAGIISDAFSAIIIVGMFVLAPTILGIIEASTTSKSSIPCTFSLSSTTAISSLPIAAVPTG